MILSQLIDAEDLMALSSEELREMILKLDDAVVYGSDEDLLADAEPIEQSHQPS
jgi:hypothetical protein